MHKDLFDIIFRERFVSLLEDGYLLKVDSTSPALWYRKLRHMTNGNVVVLKGYPHKKLIEQYTNGLLKFVGSYDDSTHNTMH